MTRWIGRSFIIIGILHSVVGFIAYREILIQILGEHLVNTISVSSEPDREAAFWFLITGFALMIVGALVDWIERRNIGMPAFLLWSFISITAIGVLIMPISGFWLFLIPIWGLFSRLRST